MPTFTMTKNWDDGTVLTEAMLDDIKTSTETFLNTTKLDSDNIQTGGIATANLASSSVTEAKLSTSVAGSGLAGGGGSALSVNVDGTGIEISADTLQLKDLGVLTAKINDSAVTTAKINDGAVTAAKLAAAVAGDGLAGGAGTALSVSVDNSTLEINTDTVRVKDAGITAAKLAAAVAGDGLAGGAGTALSVNVDGSTLEISSDSLRVKDAGITKAKLASLGQQLSSSTSTYTNNTTSYTTAATVTITGTGRPIWVGLQPDGDTTNVASITATEGGVGTGNALPVFQLQKNTGGAGANTIALFGGGEGTQANGDFVAFAPGAYWFIDTGATAAQHVYTFNAKVLTAGDTVAINYCKLVAYEL